MWVPDAVHKSRTIAAPITCFGFRAHILAQPANEPVRNPPAQAERFSSGLARSLAKDAGDFSGTSHFAQQPLVEQHSKALAMAASVVIPARVSVTT